MIICIILPTPRLTKILWRNMRKRLAIDLGTANTLVWIAGEGIVANEPTVVAVSVEDNNVIAVGEEAKRMLGRTPETLAALRPMRAPAGHMIVDMGGGAAEAAVISLSGVVVHNSVRVAGNKIDEAIQGYIKKKYNLIVGDQTAEDIKIKIGSATKLPKDESIEVSGRDVVFGLPRTVVVTAANVTEAIRPPLLQIVGAVKAVLEETPPELASDIIDKGIVMSGGTSLLRNFDKLMTEETGVSAHVAEDALFCVVRGTGTVLENIDLWKRSLTTKR